MRILNQNPRTDADSKFDDPHISDSNVHKDVNPANCYIGVGDGERGQLPPQKNNLEKYFSGKNHVKFGHFVIFFGHISCKIREFC